MGKKAKRQRSAARRTVHPLDDWEVRRHFARLNETYGVGSGMDFPPLAPPDDDDDPPPARTSTPRHSKKRERLWEALRAKYLPNDDGPEKPEEEVILKVGHTPTPAVIRKLAPYYKEHTWDVAELNRHSVNRALRRRID